MKHRGISYLDDAIDEEAKNTSQYKEAISRNKHGLAENKYPCQIQQERLHTLGKYRGDVLTSVISADGTPKEDMYSNVFTISSYIEEIKQILNTHKLYYEFINDDFIEQYLKIFESKRKYYIGPGNEKSRTDYGIYRKDGETWKNLFDILIGRCTIYKKEFRASRASYTVERFNLLNDLNNIKVKGEKLTYEQKQNIIENILTAKIVNVMKFIEKECACTSQEITGYRIDKQDKPEFHKFETYRKMKKEILEKLNWDIETTDKKLLDQIAHELTINTERESIVAALNELKQLSEEEIDFFVMFRKNNTSLFSGWSSFSLKLMYEIMDTLETEPKNQSEILHEMGKFNQKIDIFRNCSEIPAGTIVEDILNPVVAKSIRQSIGIINALVSKYGEFQDIVIEMPRESNDEEQRKNKTKMQKQHSDTMKKIESDLSNRCNIPMTEKTYYNHKGLVAKLKLWWEQDKRCLYSGKEISPEDLINKPNMFDIDHIIPIAVSFDDSQSNKVLVYSSENRVKSKRTPFQYLKSKSSDWNYEEYKKYVQSLFKNKLINKKKFSLLLFEGDITKQDVLQGFISRNLNDTRYAAKTLLNSLQAYMKANEIETKIKVVNGSFTNQFRKRLHLEKDREENYSHHAVDALICALSTSKLKKYNSIIDLETGEMLDKEEHEKMLQNDEYEKKFFTDTEYETKLALEKAAQNTAYSHKVSKKVNRALSNQTIYSTRNTENGEYVVSKIKNLYDKANYDSFKKIYDKDKTKFLTYKNDQKTWELLEKVIEMYPDAKKESPFQLYKDEFGAFRKYSKKGNGPEITTLKYLNNKLGNHLDISSNYDTQNKKVVLLSLNPYRGDIFKHKDENKFKLLRLNYCDFKFEKGVYILPEKIYMEKMKKSGIDSNYEFMFSLYANDSFEVKCKEKDAEIYRYVGASENGSIVEVKPFHKSKFEDRKKLSLGTIEDIAKINTDILGNRHYTKKEVKKLKFKLDI